MFSLTSTSGGGNGRVVHGGKTHTGPSGQELGCVALLLDFEPKTLEELGYDG